MTRTYLFSLASVLLCGALCAQTAPSSSPSAAPPPGRGPGGPGGFRGPLSEKRLTQELGLTAEQQNTLHTAIQESRVNQQGMAQKEGDARTRLAAAVKSGNEAQIDSISTELSQLHQQRTAAQAKTWAKVYSSLTAAQKTRVEGELNRAMGVPGAQGPGPAGPRGPRRGPPPPPPPAAQ